MCSFAIRLRDAQISLESLTGLGLGCRQYKWLYMHMHSESKVIRSHFNGTHTSSVRFPTLNYNQNQQIISSSMPKQKTRDWKVCVCSELGCNLEKFESGGTVCDGKAFSGAAFRKHLKEIEKKKCSTRNEVKMTVTNVNTANEASQVDFFQQCEHN